MDRKTIRALPFAVLAALALASLAGSGRAKDVVKFKTETVTRGTSRPSSSAPVRSTP